MGEVKNEQILRASKGKWAGVLAISLAFTVLGIFLIGAENGVAAWLTTVFFGLGTGIAAVALMPDASYLQLRAEGFQICSLYRKSELVAWAAVTNFRVVSLPPAGNRMVAYDRTDEGIEQGLRTLNRAMVGAGDALPDTYGMKAEALAELMNRWRGNFSR